MFKNSNTKRGECEASHFDGLGVDVNLTLSTGNIWLCEDCLAEENKTLAANKAVKTLDIARRIDSSIEIKADVFNSNTVPFIELQAAIMADSSIPADRKHAALIEECDVRIKRLNEVIFAEEQALMEKKNLRHAYHVNAQETLSRLQAADQEKYRQYAVGYKPAPVAKPRVVKVGGTSGKKSFTAADKTALYDACKKYGVPAPQVQSIITAQNKSAEEAAKYLAGLMGLIQPV